MTGPAAPGALVARWRAHVASPDASRLWEMLHPQAVFHSPIVHSPQRGRDLVFAYLSAAEGVLGGESFRYVGQWLADDGAILEFEADVDGIHVNGIDMIRWDADGRIVDFKVMVRPLKAIQMVHGRMADMLAAMKAASALPASQDGGVASRIDSSRN